MTLATRTPYWTGKIAKAALALFALAFACVLASFASAHVAYAENDTGQLQAGAAQLSTAATSDEGGSSWSVPSSATIKSYATPKQIMVSGYTGDDPYGFWAESLDESVITVNGVYYDGTPYFELSKQSVGTATVVVYGPDDYSRQITVTCKPTPLKLNRGNFTFAKKTANMSSVYYSVEYDGTHASDSRIVKVKSSKRKVATAKLTSYQSSDWTEVQVTPKKKGKTKITFWDQYGQKKTVTVKVKKKYFKANLKAVTYAYAYYGQKKMTVYTKPKAKVTIKIGSEKRTKKANKNGYATIKLKNKYKLNKKFKVTAKTARAKVKKSAKVTSNTYAYTGSFWSCKYYIPVTVRNAHKGDKVIIKAGNESYSSKISYVYSDGTYSTTFYFNHTISYYYDYRIIVKNKYGQKLYDNTTVIHWN